jgi:hypothetical protein
MPRDDRDAPPLTPLADPTRNQRRAAATLRREYDRQTGIESRAEAQERYRELGLPTPDPEPEFFNND